MTGSPDARYLEDQECWHHGRPSRVEATSAPVTAICPATGTGSAEIQDPSHAPPEDEQRAILRRIERLRGAGREIAAEIMELERQVDDLNGGGR